jgi:hypothetical protein
MLPKLPGWVVDDRAKEPHRLSELEDFPPAPAEIADGALATDRRRLPA